MQGNSHIVKANVNFSMMLYSSGTTNNIVNQILKNLVSRWFSRNVQKPLNHTW